MNKYNRSKHIKIISLIEEAVEKCSHFVQDSLNQDVWQLMMECQDAAIILGEHIEKLYGLQTQTVVKIELFCDKLYEFSISTNEESLGELIDAFEIMKMAYYTEFPEKKEIVFLPYKASMWDSLESVWEAAMADENCEVFVVPIPYYERNDDYSFGELHYEIDLFPKNVQVTSYEAYDLELHHPEVIYIHNPYDEYNRVTSIMPEYYSSKIKNYTDMLVYIPYFVVEEDCSEKKVETYANVPAVFNADRVIVQSEKIRKMYINALEKQVKNISRKTWESKILGLGSPKFDAVYKHVQSQNDIPEEWKEIIGNKKVVLYNTHLCLLMPTSYKKFLKKLRSVIELFKKRDDVVLLWRPHPLMISTAKSMNPDALDEYMDIVNEFCENKYGIYDDTADMNRALAISDAYYGSKSSMCPLYKATGKPVLLHSIYVDLEDTE